MDEKIVKIATEIKSIRKARKVARKNGDDNAMEINNILVYATPFEISQGKWGYKWIGFYNGKRLTIIEDPSVTEISFMETSFEENNYVFSKSCKEELPMEIKKFIYSNPLSNRYFLYGKDKEITIEIVMQIIEKGYDISDIKMEIYSPYGNEKQEEPFLCRYICKENEKVLVEIQEDRSILWREGIYD